MPLSFTQTSNAPSGAAPALVTREAVCLDAASNAKLIRLALKSLLLVLACVLVKLPLAPLVLLLFLIFLKSRHRLQATDLVAVWLVAAPFLGPYIAVHLGGRIPDLNFNRLFVLLLL